jgi:membrane protein
MSRDHADKKGTVQRLTAVLWEDHAGKSWLSRWFFHELRVFYFIIRGFVEHQCPLQASALTFVTLLSMVPVLALGVALINGLTGKKALVEHPTAPPTVTRQTSAGSPAATTATVHLPPASSRATTAPVEVTSVVPQDETLQGNLDGVIRDVLTRLTIDQDVRDRIISYVQKTNFAALKAVGLILLIFTAISALSTMEHVFNQIWGVRRARSVLRKFTDYLFVVIVCPFLLAGAMAMTTTLSRNALVGQFFHVEYVNVAVNRLLRLTPYLSVWVALTLLYLFLPNTRVKLRCALTGGFVAGVVWQFAFWCYTKLQVGMSTYSLVYSTLAALPFFLSWLYVSWLIVLFGAEVAAAYQNSETYLRERMTRTISPAERLRIGLNLILAICSRFRREEPPWNADQLSRYLECPPRLVDDLLADLAKAGIIGPAGAEQIPAYQPAVPLNNISPARVVEAIQECEAGGMVGTATPEAICARTLMEQWRHGLWRELGQVGFDVLVEEIRPTSLPVTAEKSQ